MSRRVRSPSTTKIVSVAAPRWTTVRQLLDVVLFRIAHAYTTSTRAFPFTRAATITWALTLTGLVLR